MYNVNNSLVLLGTPEIEIYPNKEGLLVNTIKDLINFDITYVNFLKQVSHIAKKYNIVIKINGDAHETSDDYEFDFVLILNNLGEVIVESFGYIYSYLEMEYQDELLDMDIILERVKTTSDLESPDMQELKEMIEYSLLGSDIHTISNTSYNDEPNYEVIFLEAFPTDLSIYTPIKELEELIEEWGDTIEEIISNYAESLENEELETLDFNSNVPISKYFKS